MGMTNYSVGHDAEIAAETYLKNMGFSIVERNWKTRYCEIDIVAQSKNIIHFIEVKYRADGQHGWGYEYVNKHKLTQMRFAADMWISNHQWSGSSELGVISIDNDKVSYFSAVD